eukprot:TRINITY_DN231_c0_g1_i3.p1 TRINITY_DN231_c0_g1~~TRINITY_DN231_c0_g1_i3.p1  ORF type:complete len:365 (+),score=118.77 TRINITY_DN231_c0_g1_i3:129-1223(+)
MWLQPGETDDQIIAWMPEAKILFPSDNIYKALLNGYTIRGSIGRSVSIWTDSLNKMISMRAEIMVPEHTLPVYGVAAITDALTSMKFALVSLHTQTVNLTNLGWHLDDIVTAVTIPEPYASHPYVRQFYGYAPWIVRAIFTYYLGWYSGDVETLESLSYSEHARRLVGLAGAPIALTAAKEAITEHTREGVIWALQLSKALLIAHPSPEALAIYKQALAMLGWTHPSANGRNWFLSELKKAQTTTVREEPVIEEGAGVPMVFVMNTLPFRFVPVTPAYNQYALVRFTDMEGTESELWYIDVRHGVVVEVLNIQLEDTPPALVVECTSVAFRAALNGNPVPADITVVTGSWADLTTLLACFPGSF